MADRKLQVSFGGCGFLGVYHVGVGKCVVDHSPHLFDEFDGFYGASAGAISAVCAACKSDPMEPYKWIKKTFEASRKYRLLGMLHPSFDLYGRLRKFLDEFLPKDAHRRARGKVKISLTTFPAMKNWMVSNFTTRKELIDAIIASSFIPGYAGLKDLPKFRGKRCFDGGFTSNIPFASNPEVITVSPFSGACDICPQGESATMVMINLVDQPIQLSLENITRLTGALTPTSWPQLEALFYQGYQDALRFLKLEGIIAKPVVRPLWRASCKEPSAVTATETTSNEDETSDYYSLSGYSSPMSHSRSHSLCTEYLSCLEEEDRKSDHTPPVPFPLTSLEEELEELEMEEQLKQLELRRGSSEEAEPPSHSYRLSWLLHSCSPLQLPLIHRVGRLVGLDRWQESTLSEAATEDSWDRQVAGGPRFFHSIVASWPSSMAAF